MPSGQTHDRITLWSLPVVTGFSLVLTRSGDLTLLVSGGFLFSGLMLSPDLDLHSRPFKRWGWLRWIWIPYQKVMSHRSILSHGPIIGTTLRVLYLAFWIALLGLLLIAVVELFRDTPGSRERFTQAIEHLLVNYRAEWIALFVGLELGAMSHSISDWISSAYKRNKRKSQRKSKTSKQSTSRRNTKK